MNPDAVRATLEAKLLADTEAYNPTDGTRMLFRSAEGAFVTDLEGRRYVDLINGDGQVTLGHGHPAVSEALERAIRAHGSLITGPTPDLANVVDDLAERLGADYQFAFFCSGSEANLAVVHGYRQLDLRPVIVSAGYHGWPPLWRVHEPILEPNRYGVVDWFFCLDLLEDALERHANRVGLVTISPDHVWLDTTFYDQFFAIVSRHAPDAVVCCDDALQGLRYGGGCSLRSWQDHVDVVVLGKALSNGNRVIALAARPGQLPLLPGINSSVAYEATALAAARATLEVYRRVPVFEEIRARGNVFLRHLREHIQATAAPVEIHGDGIQWQMVFPSVEVEERFLEACFRRDVLVAGFDTQKPSHAIDEAIYDRVLHVFREALAEIPADKRSATITPLHRALAASHVLHGVPPLAGLDAASFIRDELLTHVTAAGLISEKPDTAAN